MYLYNLLQVGCSGGTLWDRWDTWLQGLRQTSPMLLVEAMPVFMIAIPALKSHSNGGR